MKKYISVIAIAAMCFAACKPSDFGDLNTTPYALSKVSTRSLLTNAIKGLPGLTSGLGTATFYAQYLSEGPYPGASLYSGKSFDFNGSYQGFLFDLEKIIDVNSGKPTPGMVLTSDPVADGAPANQIAVARILKAYTFWTMTDRWGDIPYSKSLKGIDGVAVPYDKQEDIYTALFKELAEAQAQIQVGQAPVGGDILFHGDMAQWKTFANTTRMMMALRLKKNKPAVGKAEFNAAIAAGVITSASKDVNYNYLDDPNNYNPIYSNYSISLRNDYAISNTLVDYMNSRRDPRVKLYGEVLASGAVKGLPYGTSAAVSIPNAYSKVGMAFRDKKSPALIFSYAQVLFAKAEMALADVAWLPGGDAQAATYYQDAIKASFASYGLAADKADTYLTEPAVVYNPATGLKQIISEKWVHLYLNGFEAWTDWRRTGFPELTPAPNALQSGGIPVRYGYPTNEATVNKVAYNEVIARQGPDNNYVKIWWNK